MPSQMIASTISAAIPIGAQARIQRWAVFEDELLARFGAVATAVVLGLAAVEALCCTIGC